MECIPDETSDTAQAGPFAGRRDLPPKPARVAAPVEVNSQPRPRGFWDAIEVT